MMWIEYDVTNLYNLKFVPELASELYEAYAQGRNNFKKIQVRVDS